MIWWVFNRPIFSIFLPASFFILWPLIHWRAFLNLFPWRKIGQRCHVSSFNSIQFHNHTKVDHSERPHKVNVCRELQSIARCLGFRNLIWNVWIQGGPTVEIRCRGVFLTFEISSSSSEMKLVKTWVKWCLCSDNLPQTETNAAWEIIRVTLHFDCMIRRVWTVERKWWHSFFGLILCD